MNKHVREYMVREFQRGDLDWIVFWSPLGCFVRRSHGGRVELG